MTPQPFIDESVRCRTAQKAWAQLSVRQRLRCVQEFRHQLVESADELTAAVEKDVHRPPVEVMGSDVLPLAAAAKFLQRSAGRLLAPRAVAEPPVWLFGQRDEVHRRPLGVVGIIGTWNYPIFLNGVQILQALTAGNGVLWKPSEFGPTSAAVLHRLLINSAFPADLIQVLPSVRDAGPRLVESDIDHLVFTGSSAVGKRIAVRLAERLIPSTLELSGVDAMFVLKDADIGLAARAACFGVSLNRGQTCLAVRRIFIDRQVLDAWVAAMRPLLEAVGDLEVVSDLQAEQAREMIADAKAAGGTAIGTVRNDGRMITPHVFLNGNPSLRICREECFAPLAVVLPFDNLEGALAMEAQCGYALGASVFTAERQLGDEIAARLRVGSVSINDLIAPIAHPSTPFGGQGTSGWGVTQGAEGLRAMSHPQTVTRRIGNWRPHFDRPTPSLGKLLGGLLRISHGRWWWSRRKKAGA
ncbi:MAG: aldehyde dehydrogenase family protein [Gemmataceae bacterium]|nr:aldehyde dehydrogenase family protein [Gemmataceae bacterium]